MSYTVFPSELTHTNPRKPERRKDLARTDVKTYDDSSLGGRRRSVQFAPTADDAGTNAGQDDEGEEAEAEEEDPTTTQAYWRDRRPASKNGSPTSKPSSTAPGSLRIPII